MTWEPIETAPKDGTMVDLWFDYSDEPGDRIANCWWSAPDGHWWGPAGNAMDLRSYAGAVTHWMPLPAPPSPLGEEK